MTTQKIIKTEKDYNLALRRIEKLMDAKTGTSEFDELELLSTLVEIYEDKYYPISMPDKEARELAEKHWKFLEKWLHMIYVDALVHGIKHGQEKK